MTNSNPVEETLLADAQRIAAAAAALTLKAFRGPGGSTDKLAVNYKADGSEVTAADRGAEQLVRDALAEHYPDDSIVGEEFGTTEGSTDRTWIIDPIDGTTSFVRGVPLYSSLLAVFDRHGPAVGIVTIPALGLALHAGRGRGAYLNGEAARVNDHTTLDGAIVSSSAFDLGWWNQGALLALTGSGAKTRTWGDGYGYLMVATGHIEAMTDPGLNKWDIAPMLTILPEAGGRISQWNGDTDLATGSWLASNGDVHDELVGILEPFHEPEKI